MCWFLILIKSGGVDSWFWLARSWWFWLVKRWLFWLVRWCWFLILICQKVLILDSDWPELVNSWFRLAKRWGFWLVRRWWFLILIAQKVMILIGHKLMILIGQNLLILGSEWPEGVVFWFCVNTNLSFMLQLELQLPKLCCYTKIIHSF